MDTPYDTVLLGTVASTQPEALRRFRGDPVLVSATRQTDGRGRSGNTWIAARRAVAASLAIPARWPPETQPRLALVAGLAACDVLDASGGLDAPVGLKWPNDLMAGDAKVGGIIAEGHGEVLVIGLGINLWWPDPIPGAGALAGDDPGADEPHRIARAWADRVLMRSQAGPENWGRAEYLRRCTTIGRRVVWHGGPGPGTAVGVTPDGALEVDLPSGRTAVHAGAVTALRTVQ